MESRARPTTRRPVTAPPLKAVRRAAVRPFEAASAVRTLAITAIRMPKKPAARLQAAPTIKPKPVGRFFSQTMAMKRAKAMRETACSWRFK